MLLSMEYFLDAIYSLPVLNRRDAFLTVVASALTIHAIYKKYEVQPSSYFLTFLLLILTPFLSSSFLPSHFSSLSVAYFTGFSTFYISLITSIATYRLSPWHPLAKYPGPVLAKLSKFWMLWFHIRGKKLMIVEEQHKKYGRYVRLGPNELSFADADLLPALLATDMPRGPMWDGRRNPDAPPPMSAIRSSAEHALKRVPWTHAFSSASVREYQPSIAKRVSQLVGKFEKLAMNGSVVDLAEWMSYFAFDLKGDMAFGGGFELMRDGDVSGLWKMMIERAYTLGWQMHLPWATRLLLKVPSATEAVERFRKFAIECAMRRKMKGALVKDFFYHLVNENSEDSNSPPSLNTQDFSEVIAACELAIVAGSDTASVTLSGVFFYLITHPECYERLQREIDETFPTGEDPMADPNVGTKMAEMKYLNAVINETMRLQPAVPTAIQRAPEKGTGGKFIGGHWLPEGTAVNITSYVIHRDPEYFSPAPEVFWPDRWIVKSGSPTPSTEKASPVRLSQAAFIPFSAGHANCVGKNLALEEMRAVIVCLVQKFDMRLEKGYDVRRWREEMEDWFVLKLGELPVVLSLRT